ncbi:hypothetical protein KYX90_13580, partial [Enterococcus lactis]|nr:hypothetical protein [Enterococcus lactis]
GAGFQLSSLSVRLYLSDMAISLDIRTHALQHLFDTYNLSFLPLFSLVAIIEVVITPVFWWIGKRENTEKKGFSKRSGER